MQTALHIRSLVKQLEREAVGGRIVATEFYKKERAAWFIIKSDKGRQALGMVYHPAGFGSFLVPASKMRLDTREKPWPIFKLDGCIVEAVNQYGLDRIFELVVVRNDERYRVVFEAIGANGNIWLLDDQGGRLATLRKRDFVEGEPYEASPQPAQFDPYTVTAGELATVLNDDDAPMLGTFLSRQVMGFNKTMAYELLERCDIDGDAVPTEDRVQRLVAEMRRLAEAFDNPDAGYMHRGGPTLEVYPFKLRVYDEQPEKYKTLSLAVQAMVELRQVSKEEESIEKTVRDAVKRAVKRLRRRLGQIQNDIEKAADYEKYRKYGELLKINLPSIKRGMAEVTVDDVYHDPPAPVSIPLDPALPPHENAEEYFKKHRKGKEGLELLERRLEITRSELEEIEQIAAALDANFDAACRQYRSEIDALLPKEGVKRDDQPRLPYREHTLSTGLTIYIGRDGSDNDRTTFEFARPYELWFHTQQCPGSHVVMKFPNKSFEPSPKEIAETAAIAAWHSKAKNDSAVPVVYTPRKYVRKPRKAKPGLVTVEREKSLMVEPKKPE